MLIKIDERDLDSLEAISKKASKGPWSAFRGIDVQDCHGNSVARCHGINALPGDAQEANKLYVAEACSYIPALVVEIRELRRQNDALRNDFLYMDVTTVCPDCTMQGKDSHGCKLCGGRGRAYTHDIYKRENAALRATVEAHIWLREVELYDPWLDHPYAGETKGNAVKSEAFENAIESMKLINIAALKDAGLEEKKDNDL